MINTEKAFDMLPYIADIYEKVDLGKYIATKKFEAVKNKDKKANEESMFVAGLDMFKYVMKKSPKIKEEFFNIVAIIEDKSLEEVKAQELGQTIKTVKELFEDIETMDFFKQAM